MSNEKTNVRRLSLAAIFTALVAVLTYFPHIPIPGGYGYIHLGDSMIYACAWAVGGPLAGIASGFGSALTDILSGYPQYALATLVIKFFMGYVAYLIMKAFKYRIGTNIFAMVVSAVIMVVGYSLFEFFLTGKGGAIAVIPFNLIQGAGGVITGAIIITVLDKIKALDQYIDWKEKKSDEQD